MPLHNASATRKQVLEWLLMPTAIAATKASSSIRWGGSSGNGVDCRRFLRRRAAAGVQTSLYATVSIMGLYENLQDAGGGAMCKEARRRDGS